MLRDEKVYFKNPEDSQSLRRSLGEDKEIGIYFQNSPYFFTKDYHPLWLADIYRGCSAFLCLGGPSFRDIDKDKLRTPGFVTMGVNNIVSEFIPDLWVTGDAPFRFMESIFKNPRIMKFIPHHYAEKSIYDTERERNHSKLVAGDCPNMCFFKRTDKFVPKHFLTQSYCAWMNSNNEEGKKSTLYLALKILFLLGIRDVYLLGCDFAMDKEDPYAFDMKANDKYIKKNNKLYEVMCEDLKMLKPHFQQYGFNVWNCNPESNLKVFDFINFNDAITKATKHMPVDENTTYMYKGHKEGS